MSPTYLQIAAGCVCVVILVVLVVRRRAKSR